MVQPSGPIAILCGTNDSGEIVPIGVNANRELLTAGATTTVDASDVTYTPTTAADWDGGVDPGNQDAANDQLAERVKDLEVIIPNDPFPIRAEWFHDADFVVTGNPLTLSIQNTFPYCLAIFQNAEAINDQFKHSCALKAGSYTIKLLGSTDTNRGQLTIDFTLSGQSSYTTIVSNQEWYSGSTVVAVANTATFTIPVSGVYVFRFRVLAKNASSSNYRMAITKVDIFLTAGDS